jgi:hypothetical protein
MTNDEERRRFRASSVVINSYFAIASDQDLLTSEIAVLTIPYSPITILAKAFGVHF